MKKFLQVYGSGLLLLSPVLIYVGLSDPAQDTRRLSMGVLIGVNSLIVGGLMLLTAHRKR